jgi:S-formylglutathione hydrolase
MENRIMKKLPLNNQMMGTVTNVYRLWMCIFLAVVTVTVFANSCLGQEGEARYVLDEITSPALEGNLLGDPATRPMWVWLPPSYDTSPGRRYPTIYLLHHFTGTYMSYKKHEFVDLDVGEVAASLIAEGLMDEAILVLPDASNIYGGSFYSSNAVIGDYRTYITHDLVDYIDGKYRTIADRESRSVFGHSMGGYGALSLAIDYPDIFGAVAALGPANSDLEGALIIDGFIGENPETLGVPLIVQTPADYMAIVMTSFWTNAMYATGAAITPNPNNPPYYVDLPVQYPEKTVVSDIWDQWLDSDLVSQIMRNGNNLSNTDIYIDRGVGEVTIMPELPGIELLPAALDAHRLTYTYVAAKGDHMSYLRERTAEALKFLSSVGSTTLNE